MSRFTISILVFLVLVVLLTAVSPAAAQTDPTPLPTPTSIIPADSGVTVVLPPDQPTSLLPEGLSRIFASLGLYIVTMFTMAIGTEIVVDIFKLVLGIRSKPTAQKTLEEYQKLLPGKLENLGLAADARIQIENQLNALRDVLVPAFKVEAIVSDLHEEKFAEALAELVSEEDQDMVIVKAREVIKEQVKTAVHKLDTSSSLGKLLAQTLTLELNPLVDAAATRVSLITPDELFHQTRFLLTGKIAETTTVWARTELENLQNVSYATARRTYETQIKPQIEAFKLGGETEGRLKMQFEQFLKNLESTKQADVYLESLNRLLMEVEVQRDKLRSYWGKVFGRFRAWLGNYISWVRPKPEDKMNPIISSPDVVAGKLLEIQQRDKREADARSQQLRLVSVIIGTVLAYLLQIDSADLLRGLFPANATFLTMVVIPAGSPLLAWLTNLLGIEAYALTAGIILTGLAASAGSNFWHDQLARLESVKKTTEVAYAAVQEVKQTQTNKL